MTQLLWSIYRVQAEEEEDLVTGPAFSAASDFTGRELKSFSNKNGDDADPYCCTL